MIVLHSKKIIFVKPFKVAGTSFEIALSKYANEGDIISTIREEDEIIRRRLGYPGPQNYLYTRKELLTSGSIRKFRLGVLNRRGKKFHQHTSAANAKRLLGSSKWDDYLKITIVRDPYDTAISLYYWCLRNGGGATFEEFLSNNVRALTRNRKQYTISGEYFADFVIRFENIKRDLLTFESMRPDIKGICQSFKKITAKGNVRPSQARSTENFMKDHPSAVPIINQHCDFLFKFSYKKL